MNRLAVALLVAAVLLGVVASSYVYGFSRERAVRADLHDDVCELRDAVIDVLVLARANPVADPGFYELSIARLHRIHCP